MIYIKRLLRIIRSCASVLVWGILCLTCINPLFAATYFVSTSGDDTNPGSMDQPLASLQKGHDVAKAGDTVFIRGGTYAFVGAGANSTCGIYITKSGQSDSKRIYFWAYKAEKAVFDFAGLTLSGGTSAGIRINGSSWLHFKGLEICNVPQPGGGANNGIWCNPGSNIIFELCVFHHNSGPGLSIANGNGGHLVLNCDSHDNYDAGSNGEDADGFGVHYQTAGTSTTVIRGCRAWWNADDGFDCIHQNVAVIVENSWFWLNGYKTGTMTAAGNGQGVKGGGYNLPPSKVPSKLPQNTIRFCVSFLNRSAGFNTNYHPIANYWYNNTAFNNKGSNFYMQGITIKDTDYTMTGLGVLKNNIAFTGTAISSGTGSGIDAANNSWNLSGVSVSSADFLSVDTTGIYGPRKADGSLPDVKFLKLAAGSDLIDKGVDLGFPFSGATPDLGAYEFGSSGVSRVFQVAFPEKSPLPHLRNPGAFAGEQYRIFDVSGRRLLPEMIDKSSNFIFFTGRSVFGASRTSFGPYIR
jgi:hypothetical protein